MIQRCRSWVKSKSRRKKPRKSRLKPRRRRRLLKSRKSNKVDNSWTPADTLGKLEQAAAAGASDATFALGLKYEQGFGIASSLSKAAKCYRQAGQLAHLDAQVAIARLARLYEQGKPLPQDEYIADPSPLSDLSTEG